MARRVKTRAKEGDESLLEFLARKLPPRRAKQAHDVANAVLQAGERYNRYAARRNDWLNYAIRGGRLKRISRFAEQLVSDLCELDILSRDDLETRFQPKQIETLIGLLQLLNKQAIELTQEIQKDGRRRDVAQDRWIVEIADIYENAFGQTARAWAAITGSTSAFYRLLELSRPRSFFQHGKLTIRQVERMLKKRDFDRRLRNGTLTFDEAVLVLRAV